MKLLEMIRGLVDSADNSGCCDGLTVVEEKWVEKLENYLQKEESKANEGK